MAVTTFHVVNGDGGSLLSYSTVTELDIVKMNVHAVVAQSSSTSYTDPQEDHKQFGNENPDIPKNHQPDSPIMSKFKKEYPAVFNGIGKLKGTPTPFVSNLVVARKPNNSAEVRFDRNDNERIVAYASRSLSKVEQRYSQTEKEALRVEFGCEKFHMYLIGIEFALETDHKPLEVIYHPKAKPSERIERWALRLQQYQFKLRHRPSKTNSADVLSRKRLSTLE
ncbi:Hypothetical predicted protein [Paramuricea clavata]|uniref:Reverse transcriptase RNase H-like domain-containing protein n=1 Tax=Paramuricea clavata TaxID=317549 RepID=A0A7D9LUM1_PARCT|nr:Hypothetical predicted protein [Paramuricea clavata]